MDYFDKIGGMFQVAAKEITTKTKEVTEVTKIKLKLKEKEDSLTHLYEELGRKYFEEHKQDINFVYGEMEKIIIGREEYAKIKEELAVAKGMKFCEKCGTPMGKDAAFCESCGARSTSQTVYEEEMYEAEEAQDKTESEKE